MRRIRRSLRVIVPALSIVPIISVVPVALLLAGCGEGPSRPLDAAGVVIEGAFVPEMAEAESEIAIEIWGRAAAAGAELDGFDLRWTDASALLIEPRVRRAADRESSNGEFHRQVAVRVSEPGVHTVRIAGADRSLEFPVHVYPRGVLVHLVARDPIAQVHEELVIDAGGWAVAMRRGETPPVRAPLPPERVRELIARFHAIGFQDFQDRYVSQPPAEGLVIAIAFAPPGSEPKRVIAERSLAPDSFASLAADLRAMLRRILEEAPDAPAIRCVMHVEPVEAAAGTPRRITLRLENRGERPFIRLLPTAQIYDIAVLEGPMEGAGGWGRGDRPMSRIWNWANGRVFEPIPTELRLEPGETRAFDVEWPGTSNEGDLVSGGLLHAVGVILGEPPLQAHPARLIAGAAPPPPAGLSLSLSIEPRSAPPGVVRRIHLTAENPTRRPIVLAFSSSQEFDFLLFDPESMRPGPVWMWSEGLAFLTVAYQRIVPPGGRLEWDARWTGLLSGGAPPHPGIYELRGLVTGAPGPFTTSVRIEVVRP